jgi:Ca2+-binding EF-hand superfamily protein
MYATMLFMLSLLISGTMGSAAAGAPSGPLPGDADRDGAVSCSEAKQTTMDRFARLDINRDDSLFLEEFKEGTAKNFDAMDTDKNGMVDAKEYVIYWCAAPPKQLKSKKMSHKKKQSLHKNMDFNRNGRVSADECVVFWTVRFSEIDENNDGFITRDEFGNKVVEWYSEMDVNKDGSVTITEYTDYWIGKCEAEKMKKALKRK